MCFCACFSAVCFFRLEIMNLYLTLICIHVYCICKCVVVCTNHKNLSVCESR